MNFISKLILAIIFSCSINSQAQKTVSTEDFDKIIVSPHIETTFIVSAENKVVIESSTVDENKITIAVENQTLRVYLEGAKEWTKSEKYEKNGQKMTKSLYKGKVVTATIYFKEINELSIRGEQNHKIKGQLKSDDFDMTIYGESVVDVESISCKLLKLVTYGESVILFNNGSVDREIIRTYGESKADLLSVKASTAKIATYGESVIKLNVTEDIKLSAFGESKLYYKGNAKIRKGMNFGESEIIRL